MRWICLAVVLLVGCATEAPYTPAEVATFESWRLCYMALDFTGYSATSTARARDELRRRRCDCTAEWPRVQIEIARDQVEESRRAQALSAAAAYFGAMGRPSVATPARPTGFLKRQYQSGMNRVCVYDELGSERAVTVGATELCPLSY